MFSTHAKKLLTHIRGTHFQTEGVQVKEPIRQGTKDIPAGINGLKGVHLVPGPFGPFDAQPHPQSEKKTQEQPDHLHPFHWTRLKDAFPKEKSAF